MENNRGRKGGEVNRQRAKSRAVSKTPGKKELRSKTIDGGIRAKSKSSKRASTNQLNVNLITSSNKLISEIHTLTKTLNLNSTIVSTKFLKFNFQFSKLEKYVEHCLEFTNLSTISLDKTQDFNNLVKSIRKIPLPKEIILRIKNDFRSYLKGEKVKSLGGLANIFSKKEEENLSLNFKGEKPTFLMLMSMENIKRELNHLKNLQQIVDEKQFKEINFVVLFKQGNIITKEYKKMLKKIGIKHDADNIKFFRIVNKKNIYSSNFLLLGVLNFDEKLSYHNILITKEGKFVKTLDNKLDDIKSELKKLLIIKEDVVNNLKIINPDEIIDEKICNRLEIENVDIKRTEIQKIKEFFKGNCEKIRKLNVNLEKINFSYFVSYNAVNNKFEKYYSFKPKIEISIQKKYSNFVNNLNEFLKLENLTEKIIFQHNVLDLKQEYLAINEMIEHSFKSENLPYNQLNFSILKTNTTDIYEGYHYFCSYKFISKLWMKTIDFQLYSRYEKISAEINTKIEKYNYLKKITLKPKKMVGDIFDSIELVKSVTNKKSVISSKNNEVLVVEFWDTLCLDCIDSMNENQKNLKKNKNWKEQVRFIGLSIDENLDELKKCIKENKLNLIEHYIIDKVNEKSKVYLDAYGANSVPRLVIVNKFGKIAFLGSPFDIDINEVINELVHQKEELQVIESLKDLELEDYDDGEDEAEDEYEDDEMEEEEDEDEGQEDEGLEDDEIEEEECDLINIDHNTFKTTRNLIVEHMYYLSRNNYNQATFIEEKCLYNFKINDFRKILKTFNFSTNLRQKDHSFLESLFISKVYPIIPKETLKPNLILMKTFQLFRGDNCNICKNNLTAKSQYFCFECQIFFCDLCANKEDSSKRGMERLTHNHNLIFIPSCVTQLTEIDVVRMGKNKASKEKNIKRRDHDNACNCCEKMIEGSRFVCMNCYPGVCDNFTDLCEKCLMILLDEKHIDNKETVKSCLENDGHKIDSHVYLRLWFCNGSYTNY